MNKQYRNALFSGKVVNDINGFTNEYFVFSNSYIHPTIFLDLPFGLERKNKKVKRYYANNVETLLQAAKLKNPAEIKYIINAGDPKIAKFLGERFESREDWKEIRETVLKVLLKKKFQVCNQFRNMLLNVKKDYMIINFNNTLDDELGVSRETFAGQNKLGFLLMELKNEMENK